VIINLLYSEGQYFFKNMISTF